MFGTPETLASFITRQPRRGRPPSSKPKAADEAIRTAAPEQQQTARAALQEAIHAAGGAARLAHKLGISRQAIDQWQECPSARVGQLESLTGVPRQRLRPDLDLGAFRQQTDPFELATARLEAQVATAKANLEARAATARAKLEARAAAEKTNLEARATTARAKLETRAATARAKLEARAAATKEKLETRATTARAKLEARAAATEAKLEARAAADKSKLKARAHSDIDQAFIERDLRSMPVARALGVSERYVDYWRRGLRRVGPAEAKKLHALFDVPLHISRPDIWDAPEAPA